jgi:dephospho-CoA kinase
VNDIHVPVIGIVGGIGAGKSTVAREFAKLGCIVIDSDKLAHDAYRDANVVEKVLELLGPGVMSEGQVNRKAVAKVVFNDVNKRKQLEAIVHPAIEARRRQLMQEHTGKTRAFILDSPLLLEAGLSKQCDAIVFVEVSKAERLRRVMTTRGWDEAELARREASQWPVEKKRSHATHVLNNQQDEAGLAKSVEIILIDILTKAADGS